MERIKTLALQLRQFDPTIAAVYLFGSRVDGTHHSGSDYDLAILYNRPKEALPTLRERLALREELVLQRVRKWI